jgi:hypothetical protein
MLHSTGFLGSYLARAALILSCKAALEFAITGASFAAPITLQFEATISDGTNIPFSAPVGDVIDVSFTFEPGNAGATYPQSGGISFELSGKNLYAQEFAIRVANNENIDVPGRIADPDNTPDVDINEIGDSLVVSCQSGQLFCGSAQGEDGFVFRPVLVFSGQPSILSSSELSADPSVWNAFSLREMSLLFQDVNTGRTSGYVGAYIGEVTQVPEPITLLNVLSLVWLLVTFGIAARLRVTCSHLRKAYS